MATHDATGPSRSNKELIPREYLRLIALWSLIPGYLLAGGFIGWIVDSWVNTFPYLTGVCLIVALAVAVRDMIRLRDEFFGKG